MRFHASKKVRKNVVSCQQKWVYWTRLQARVCMYVQQSIEQVSLVNSSLPQSVQLQCYKSLQTCARLNLIMSSLSLKLLLKLLALSLCIESSLCASSAVVALLGWAGLRSGVCRGGHWGYMDTPEMGVGAPARGDRGSQAWWLLGQAII